MTDVVISRKGEVWIDNQRVEGVTDVEVSTDHAGTEVRITLIPTNFVVGEIADRGIDRYVAEQKAAAGGVVKAKSRSAAAKSVIGSMQTDEKADVPVDLRKMAGKPMPKKKFCPHGHLTSDYCPQCDAESRTEEPSK